MATITIRNLPEETKRRLRMRAAENGRSMEAEARETLAGCVLTMPSAKPLPPGNWVDEMMARFKEIGETDFELPPREEIRDPPDFSGPEFGE